MARPACSSKPATRGSGARRTSFKKNARAALRRALGYRSMMHPLDTPIWQALTTSQAQFAEISGLARRFPRDITSLGAFSAPSAEAYDSLAGLTGAGEVTNLLLEEPAEPPSGWAVVEAVPLLQMIH